MLEPSLRSVGVLRESSWLLRLLWSLAAQDKASEQGTCMLTAFCLLCYFVLESKYFLFIQRQKIISMKSYHKQKVNINFQKAASDIDSNWQMK